MEFTIKAYLELLKILKKEGYNFCLYNESGKFGKSVIIRHDVDISIEKALEMAIIENKMGVKSTYFILLSTNFYNIFSKQSFKKLQEIILLGHEIGLHFDEKRYDIKNIDEMKRYIKIESSILGKLLNINVKVVSMHRPSSFVLENDINFNNIINTYSSKYFKEMKYISDSRMNWREDPNEIIKSGNHKKLHILIHPFWYSTKNESMKYKLKEFLSKSIDERYNYLNDNFTELDKVINKTEVI